MNKIIYSSVIVILINILKNLKWTEEQQQFLGALVYDVEDCNGNELVTIVCERTEHNIKLMAIYPN